MLIFAVLKQMRERFKYLIKIFLLVAFLGYYGGFFCCTHTHFDGVRQVAHSHPFPSSGHSHSAGEMQTISQLANLAVVLTVLMTAMACFMVLLYEVVSCAGYALSVNDGITHKLRGPPVAA